MPSALVYVIYDMAARLSFQEMVEVRFSSIRYWQTQRVLLDWAKAQHNLQSAWRC
ncbi:hypothetical protein YTPLAS72_34590 [Nitrospira sp.]|nr:hypothetical protein YTPLAS72_34590 [Nitrospira sp.]